MGRWCLRRRRRRRAEAKEEREGRQGSAKDAGKASRSTERKSRALKSEFCLTLMFGLKPESISEARTIGWFWYTLWLHARSFSFWTFADVVCGYGEELDCCAG